MKIKPALRTYHLVRVKDHGAGKGSFLRAFKSALASFALSNGCFVWYARLAWWLAIYGTPKLSKIK